MGLGQTGQTGQVALYNSGVAATTPETALSASLSYFGLYGPLRAKGPRAEWLGWRWGGSAIDSIESIEWSRSSMARGTFLLRKAAKVAVDSGVSPTNLKNFWQSASRSPLDSRIVLVSV